MNSTTPSPKFVSKSRFAEASDLSVREVFCTPHFDHETLPDVLKLTIYVPGVQALGVEIAIRGTDLSVTARKAKVIRKNWQALHLEPAQRDYGLRLRLGSTLDLPRLQAKLTNGVLTLHIPKWFTHSGNTVERSQLVA